MSIKIFAIALVLITFAGSRLKGSTLSDQLDHNQEKSKHTTMQPKSIEGTQIPDVTLKTRVRDASIGGNNPFKWQDLSTKEFFADKKVIVIALPGAFTPTCTNEHLPGYEKKYDEFKKLGVDEIVCVSVNDAFVMFQWAKHLGVTHIKMLPDGSGLFTKKLNMLVKKDNLGFGKRSWRYSMFVDHGTIKKMFVEAGYSDDCPDDPFEVSDADTMLNYLRTESSK